MKTALHIPDCHIPFEDHRAYALMLQVATFIGVDEVIIGGDWLDMYGMSQYKKDHSLGDMATLYDREIECGNKRADELDKLFPKAKKIYLEGNHEDRMKRSIGEFIPALRNRISVPQELNLAKRGKWSWIPFDQEQRYQVFGSPLWVRHCPPVGGSVENVARQAGDCILYGHTHQVGETIFRSKVSGRKIHAINGGWLGDAKGNPKIFNYVQGMTNWTHAFTIIRANAEMFDAHLVKIHSDYSCYFGAKRFKA